VKIPGDKTELNSGEKMNPARLFIQVLQEDSRLHTGKTQKSRKSNSWQQAFATANI
jgi:hypothetical protein